MGPIRHHRHHPYKPRPWHHAVIRHGGALVASVWNRGHHSHTQTHNGGKRETNNSRDAARGLEYMNIKIHHPIRPWHRQYFKQGIPNTYNSGTSNVLNSGTGAQNAVGIINMFSGASWMSNYYAQWQAVQVNTSTLPDFRSAIGDARICFKRVKIRIHSTNMCNAAIDTIYYICQNRYNLESVLLPENAWQAGYADQTSTLSGSTAGNKSIIGQTPFKSKDFVQNFKVVGVRKFSLEPGQSNMFFLDMEINRMVTGDLATKYVGGLKDLGLYVMAVAKAGTLSKDSATGVVTYPNVELGYGITTHVEGFCPPMESLETTTMYNPFTAISANPQLFPEEQDAAPVAFARL